MNSTIYYYLCVRVGYKSSHVALCREWALLAKTTRATGLEYHITARIGKNSFKARRHRFKNWKITLSSKWDRRARHSWGQAQITVFPKLHNCITYKDIYFWISTSSRCRKDEDLPSPKTRIRLGDTADGLEACKEQWLCSNKFLSKLIIPLQHHMLEVVVSILK